MRVKFVTDQALHWQQCHSPIVIDGMVINNTVNILCCCLPIPGNFVLAMDELSENVTEEQTGKECKPFPLPRQPEAYGNQAIKFLNNWGYTNKKWSEKDGSVVMCFNVAALAGAADLVWNNPAWKAADKPGSTGPGAGVHRLEN